MSHQLPDIDPQETQEWVDSFDAVLDTHGRTRARFILMKLLERGQGAGGQGLGRGGQGFEPLGGGLHGHGLGNR